MPSLDPTAPGRVLVTGGNGFIGAHVIAHLLRSTPHHIIATVRTSEKATALLQTHGGANNPRLTTAVVPDITQPTAYDAAARGCDAIVHLASPFGYAYTDYESQLLQPSIAGTRAILNAANRTPSVRRVVYCSSFASVYDAADVAPSRTYTEADWSPLTYEDGKTAVATPVAYRASKVLSEREAWRLCKEQAQGGRWDLVALCPGMVFGPLVEGTLGSVTALNTSNSMVWGLLDKAEVPPTRATLWTSVVALAEAHVSALGAPEAGNERFLLLSGDYDNQELVDTIRGSTALDQTVKDRVPVGNPGERPKVETYKADGSKAAKYLKFSTPSLEETVEGLLKQVLGVEQEEKMKST
ncbi:Uu.00g090540.m01.CDS01 [Anthostomella pinea]|uniref:Uu.00g090540.m01.CDS01 n=1 Tax=Anthostomella pinea TaxID=933095 RepID=A0AAI8VHH0_9PEZI|nr:Uu.00g090540.m01.CDS01 [Anthostomella pinea]